MPQQAKLSLSRETVVDTAIECMADEGLAALGVNRVARALGIRPPSLYHYVRGNEDLRSAVALEGWRRLAERLQLEIHRLEPHTSLLESESARREFLLHRLRVLLTASCDFLRENEALHHAMSITVLVDTYPLRSEVRQEFVELFGEVLRPLELDCYELVHVTRACRSAIHGYMVLLSAGQFPGENTHTESLEWLIDVIAYGILARATRAK